MQTMSSASTITTEIHSTLKNIFGFSSFRPNQEKIIEAILAKHDVFAVMPTGGGKSLCYQLPSHIEEKTTVVISPLISLMKDQVDAACGMGLRAAFLNSTLTPQEMAMVYEELAENSLDLLYVSPERFAMESFIGHLKRAAIFQFAIDEAHCVSEWGHDFRPDYLSLSRIVEEFPDTIISAFTATATEIVQNDIVKKLGLRSPVMVRASFDRPNLFYQVKIKDDVNYQLLSFIKEHPGEPGIIYRTTRQSVEDTARFLIANGIKALPYHAGLESEERTQNQDEFNRDNIDVIVATIAFGMGIDKSNIRFVIHGDLPKNMEGYYQETGRAGRDGEYADCLLFFSRGDIPRIRYFIDQISNEEERKIALGRLQDMVNFSSLNVCRRRQILAYFGEEYSKENCSSCDICSNEVEQIEATQPARVIMSAIIRTDQRFGAVHITNIITGANTKKIREFKHNEIKTYGAGSDRDKKYWRRIIDELIGQGCIEQTEDRFPVLRITSKGEDILYGKDAFYVVKFDEPQHRKQDRFQDFNHELFNELKILRKKIADDRDVPAFVIFSDKSIHEMCRIFPSTREELLNVNGVGTKKFEKYGKAFLEKIIAFVSDNPGLKPEGAPLSTNFMNRKKKKKVSDTRGLTLSMLEEGLSYKEIAEQRGLTPSTIAGHIEQLMSEGKEIDIEKHIEEERRREIEKLFIQMNTESLRKIVDSSQNSISYDEARIVRACMKYGG